MSSTISPLSGLTTGPSEPTPQEKNPFLAALGERVRALRSRRGMTRKALALAADVSERHLANLEYGVGNASVLVLLQVAGALQCSLGELVSDVTSSSPEWLLIRELLGQRDEATLQRVRVMIGELLGTGGGQTGKGSCVALVGLRGAGKSTLGQMLAEDLDFPFIELSREIEKFAGCSVSEIQALYGINAYRRYERRALEEAIQIYPEAVIAVPGGLTRVTDKRHVRHDLADLFCTNVEGVRGEKAVAWRLVDAIAKPAVFAQKVRQRALELAEGSDRPADGKGVTLNPLQRVQEADALRYSHVTVEIDRARRAATFTVIAPTGPQPADIAAIEAAGDSWYPLAMARELEDAILSMRTNELDTGIWLIKTEGAVADVLAMDATLLAHQGHWLVRETIGLLRRTLSRLDVSSRSLFALIEPGSCFAGTLLELALACDRSYQFVLPDEAALAPRIALTEANFGLYPMVTGQSRLQRRFYDEQAPLEAVRAAVGQSLDGAAALKLGLVTSSPDDIDWADEVRIAIEERVSMSPDALTGMEANLRFNSQENMFTRIFGRLTAWQNWIFQRPNAVGEKGALKVYGKGEKVAFDWNRV